MKRGASTCVLAVWLFAPATFVGTGGVGTPSAIAAPAAARIGKKVVKKRAPRPARPAPPVTQPQRDPEPVAPVVEDQAPEVTTAPAAAAAPPAPATRAPAEPTPAPTPAEPAAANPMGDSAATRAAPAAPRGDDAALTRNVATLRAEFQSIKDALFRGRARRETLEQALLSTRLATTLRWEGGRRHVVKTAEIRLDGVRLWESRDGLTGDQPVALAARSAPPGPHALVVRVEVRARDDARAGYVSEQTFTLDLAEGKTTSVAITVDEDGAPPSYNPDIEIEVERD